ncbi:hypothetical protein IDM40_23050 [Nocardiopsis sp. HNM0947]|uniref:Secreted protein n=1 Tax=Nocardiopsis coralli TaxID=2772213 RepID=A0ABR9PCK1_9ACTN|nr:hypothetical protein [Nocardiopsis coralli]MBE3001547.1 hypothetical protein [Nocardiopsis coralli]
MRLRIILSALVVLWIAIGVFAAFQRGHFDHIGTDAPSCSTLGSTAGTVFIGPLNYFGVNPTVECPEVPEPSE